MTVKFSIIIFKFFENYFYIFLKNYFFKIIFISISKNFINLTSFCIIYLKYHDPINFKYLNLSSNFSAL